MKGYGHSPVELPCGGVAEFDDESTCYSYRCINCGSVVGSIGMSKYCKDEFDKIKVMEILSS